MQDVVLRRERVYLVLVALVSATVYFLLTLSIVGLLIALGLYLAFVIGRSIAIGYLRGNGVLATAEQFPQLMQEADEVARLLGMSRTPNVWLFQAGRILDTVTRRFVRGHHVVLANELAELAWEGESHRRALRFLLAHEFARVQRQLPLWGLLVTPGRYCPVLGKAWSRAAALTFDRMAARVAPEGAADAVGVFAAGPEMFPSVDAQRLADQASRRGFWAWTFEVLSRERPLARRLQHVRSFVADASATRAAPPPRVWSVDRVVAAALIVAAPILAAAVLAMFGPAIYEAAREEIDAIAPRLEQAVSGLNQIEEQDCPPGMEYDEDLEFCYEP